MRNVQETLDGYLEEIRGKATETGFITVKELAYILDASEGKIRNDIEAGRLGSLKMGPEGSKCHLRIPLSDALGYVLHFHSLDSDLPPIEESPLFCKVKNLSL